MARILSFHCLECFPASPTCGWNVPVLWWVLHLMDDLFCLGCLRVSSCLAQSLTAVGHGVGGGFQTCCLFECPMWWLGHKLDPSRTRVGVVLVSNVLFIRLPLWWLEPKPVVGERTASLPHLACCKGCLQECCKQGQQSCHVKEYKLRKLK